jgi:hypothetical protein
LSAQVAGDRQQRLITRFRNQQKFATDYSPLYAHLYGAFADWLSAPAAAEDPLVNWLLEASRDRQTLDFTLLLAAGIHRDILSSRTIQMPAEVTDLARYFPTAGGHYLQDAPAFESILRQTVLSRLDELASFIQKANVQTNETGRGLSWLLPILATNWEAVHVVDLGASAGLNLVADLRAYRLVDADTDETLIDVGRAQPTQFLTQCTGESRRLTLLANRSLARIIGRTGCDLTPFPLKTIADQRTLMAFVWGDQVERMKRLREGIEVFIQAESSDVPVTLHPIELPYELEAFLQQQLPAGLDHPVVIYNTYITTYLPDKGESLRHIISRWAESQERPVLWLQWEIPRDGGQPPGYGWCAWTADLWQKNRHHQWKLGWVHPHGAAAEFTSGLRDYISHLGIRD